MSHMSKERSANHLPSDPVGILCQDLNLEAKILKVNNLQSAWPCAQCYCMPQNGGGHKGSTTHFALFFIKGAQIFNFFAWTVMQKCSPHIGSSLKQKEEDLRVLKRSKMAADHFRWAVVNFHVKGFKYVLFVHSTCQFHFSRKMANVESIFLQVLCSFPSI